MEGIYQSNLYSSSSDNHPSPYVLSPHHHPEPYRPISESPSNRPYALCHSNGYSTQQEDQQNISSPLGWSSNQSNNNNNNTLSWNNNLTTALPRPSRSHIGYHNYNTSFTHSTPQRPKLTTTVWEDEGTICYQVDAKSICVARRQDNDMINGTKLLNVVGMSRGKRDGILKNEKGRVVVKVGAMHLKGVWITFSRAKDLATKFKIFDILYPLFVEDPSVFLSIPPPTTTSASSTTSSHPNSNTSSTLPYMLPSKGYYKNDNPMQQWGKQSYLPSLNQEMTIRTQSNGNMLPSEPSSSESDMYMIQPSCEYRLNRSTAATTSTTLASTAPPPPPPYSSYHLYSDHHFSSYRRSMDKEQEGQEKQISFPSSPPPEMKYQDFHSNEGHHKFASSSNLIVKQEIDEKEKGRKRPLEMTPLQHNNKRIKND
ncbi:hypothetical protein G6F37_012138 [Rhizopus arrhizus]|nr:hypothetical protein G6F38_012155 [Rhizopus arrhizus]KAG1145483.1 hypothetical protein G6F37_012138 [Rhizopus arrhizus]